MQGVGSTTAGLIRCLQAPSKGVCACGSSTLAAMFKGAEEHLVLHHLHQEGAPKDHGRAAVDVLKIDQANCCLSVHCNSGTCI
jgi:hypothetical protein